MVGTREPHRKLARAIYEVAHPLDGSAADYDPLMDIVGDARIVLLGEATHGTHEFYRERAEITKRLIEEKGFTAIAVEADWPDAWRVDRWVRRRDTRDADATVALKGFRRFPQWMWRNTDVVDFLGWLRAWNEANPSPGAGFYGIDLYSLFQSIGAVLDYLDKVDPDAARRARDRYACFHSFGENTQHYGYAASFGLTPTCEEKVIQQLVDLRRRSANYVRMDGGVAEEEYFYAEQNARLVKNAERYYRAMFEGSASSWNLRDTHMADVVDALLAHLERRHGRAKIVVWAHNSHLGDASATQMAELGEFNVGQLVRERHGAAAVSVGFTTYSGTVTAASDWGATAERKRVRPALPGSYEDVLHGAGITRFFLPLRGLSLPLAGLRERRLERAIGVIYLPQTERVSHYFEACLPDQFDAIIHFDETCAVEPLERHATWESIEPPETYPVAV